MENIQKSLYFDMRILGMRGIGFLVRLQFLINKYTALLCVALLGHAQFRMRFNRFSVKSISEIGTIQSSIVDFYDDIVASKILPKNGNPTIVDIGANIGQFSNAAVFFYPDAEIIAFEPDPVTYEKYLSNINDRDHSVTIHNCGLGSKAESKVFYRHNLSGMSSFVKPPKSNIASKTSLEIKTLDSFMLEDIDVLKIDVEGFEYDVLSGAKRTLKRADYLLMELSLKRSSKTTNLEILNLVNSLNHHAHLIKFGRPLGASGAPECQDVLMRLKKFKGRST